MILFIVCTVFSIVTLISVAVARLHLPANVSDGEYIDERD